MLTLRFLNVGNGDAILVEDREGERVFRMLIDAGRRDVGQTPGSLRMTAAEHLHRLGVEHVDVLVVTHLHEDHFGGLGDILPRVTFGQAYAGFFPALPCGRAQAEPEAVKTVRGLCQCLNEWAEDAACLAASGCRCHTVDKTVTLAPTDRLRAEIVCPDESACAWQRQAWADMLAGRPVPEGLRYWSAKYRNPGSLRVRLTYAGRTVELAGDCYGAAWEDRAAPCDILKVPHHGDAKSLTAELVSRLRPRWAVVSCGAEYIERKDRPSRAAVELLEEQGTGVLFTDSFSAPWRSPAYRRSVDIIIEEDGTVTVPAPQCGGRSEI